MAPTWFASKLPHGKVEMVPELARGPGCGKSNAIIIDETPRQREARGRFAYADAMVAESARTP